MQITLQELNMTYPNGKKALQGVSASLDSPSLIGLLGPNGAGKSTLMKLLVAGLLPTGGAIRADGEPLTKCERAYKARLGYLPQDFGLFDELTVEQFLDYMGALKGLRSGRESIRAVIEAVHLGEKRRASGASLHPHHRGCAVGVLPPAGAPPGAAALRRHAGGAYPGGRGPRGHL